MRYSVSRDFHFEHAMWSPPRYRCMQGALSRLKEIHELLYCPQTLWRIERSAWGWVRGLDTWSVEYRGSDLPPFWALAGWIRGEP